MERIKEALELARKERSAILRANGLADSMVPPTVTLDEGKPSSPQRSPLGLGKRPVHAAVTPLVELDPEHLEHHRILAHNKHDPNSGVFDLLRTQVLQRMIAGGWRTLGVVSPAPGAGKSVVAINLAMSIAQLADRTTMLVDFDLRRPNVLNYLGVKRPLSLNNYFRDECSIADVLFRAQLPDLVVAGTAEAVPQSAEVLGSQRVKALIDEVKHRYSNRITIFDLPPMLNADDALAVLPSLDCVLMVVANGLSVEHEVEQALRHLQSTNLIGAVLNRAAEGPEPYV